MTTTLTGKNQITLPAELVKELGLVTGSKIEWSKGRDGKIIGRKKMTRKEAMEKLQGLFASARKDGEDITGDLIRQRVREDEEERAQGFA
jgi:bifunctional DNA-binding transcriptional regulator/antitoxin component of YhaV-PrlF toxin-antitoxin module